MSTSKTIIYLVFITVLYLGSLWIFTYNQKDVMIEAVNKDTTKILNEFEKVKVNKNGSLNLDLTNVIEKSDTLKAKWYQFKKKWKTNN